MEALLLRKKCVSRSCEIKAFQRLRKHGSRAVRKGRFNFDLRLILRVVQRAPAGPVA